MNKTLLIAAAGVVALVLVTGYFVVSASKEELIVSAENANGEVAAVAALKEAAADLENGEAVYDYWCAACHDPGPGHPGTQSLAIKYDRERPAALEERTDLSPELTAYFVRNGFALMPFFRKTEISDADLRDLSAYLAREE